MRWRAGSTRLWGTVCVGRHDATAPVLHESGRLPHHRHGAPARSCARAVGVTSQESG
jgi:hypothetical protein